MTLLEIRETLEQPRVTLDGNGLGIVQKQITLPSNMRHQVLAVDFFQDALPDYQGATPLFIELIVTPYPVIYSDMKFSTPLAYGSRGPMAGSETVLFKSIIGPYEAPLNQFATARQFPNESVGAGPTFSFYTPYIYVTALIHGQDATTPVDGLALSFYMAVDSKKASTTSYGLGVMRERSVAQGITLMNQGRTIEPSRNVGQVFPMWKYGGIRSERMLRGNAIADFFLPYTPNETEAMTDTANLRTFIKTARSMQSFDTAFGGDDVAKGAIPDWVRFNLSPGLVSGPIRPQRPPLKHADNGNVLMFT